MGQQEVYNFLKKHKGFFTSRQISKVVGVSSGNVNSALSRMFKANEILKRSRKRTNKSGTHWIFEYKLK